MVGVSFQIQLEVVGTEQEGIDARAVVVAAIRSAAEGRAVEIAEVMEG